MAIGLRLVALLVDLAVALRSTPAVISGVMWAIAGIGSIGPRFLSLFLVPALTASMYGRTAGEDSRERSQKRRP